MADRGERFCYAEKGSPRGELAPARATERGLQFLRLIVITPLRLDKLGTSPQGEAFLPLAVLLLKKALLGESWRPSGRLRGDCSFYA